MTVIYYRSITVKSKKIHDVGCCCIPKTGTDDAISSSTRSILIVEAAPSHTLALVLHSRSTKVTNVLREIIAST